MFRAIYYTDTILKLFQNLPDLYLNLKSLPRSIIFKYLLFFDLPSFLSKKQQDLAVTFDFSDEINDKMLAFIKFNNYPLEMIIIYLIYHFLTKSKVLEAANTTLEYSESDFTYNLVDLAYTAKFFSYFSNYLAFDLIAPSLLKNAYKLALKLSKKAKTVGVLEASVPALEFSEKELLALLKTIYLKK